MYSFEEYLTVTNILVGFLITYITYYWYKYFFNHYWKSKGIPFVKPQLYIVSIFKLFRNKKDLFILEEELYKKHGRIFGAYESPSKPILYLADPELLKLIFVKDFHNFELRREINMGSKLLEDMVSVAVGEKWKRIRSIMSPTFTTGKIKGMMPHIGECAEQLTRNFYTYADNDKPVECKKLFGNFTMDVIATVAFGTKLDSHNDPDNIFVTQAAKAFQLNFNWKLLIAIVFPKLAVKLGLNMETFQFFVTLTETIIEKRKKSNEVRNDFLQIMMESLDENETKIKTDSKVTDKLPARKALSMDELVAQCVIFFFAGYESVAAAITMVIYSLALHPEIQTKVLDEVDHVWQSKNVIDAAASTEAKYLDAVISETLRLYTPNIRLERTAAEDYVLGNTGVTIKKGMIVAVPMYAIQLDEEFFPEPKEFKPERFLPENVNDIAQFTYLPFGSGPRNCIALRFALTEIKFCLLHVLKNVRFEKCEQTKIPPEFGFALMSPKEMTLKVIRRNENAK